MRRLNLLVISNQQSAISNQQSAISNQQSAISYQLSAISYQLLNKRCSPRCRGSSHLLLDKDNR
ncbi:hypothetical protein [Moorena sp. SIO3F7]|uniref:hypothetical protein n=1 Tax=Moorena sp. SIO3F7 TaxID=2607839 RepID=UPI0013FE6C53|nr:hypothetical protein [Moorena sp. SIO3F7]NEP99329.1 hypothetical protein [Moorena sp. SIO3F7]